MSRSNYHVRLLPVAETDLAEIITYIAVDQPLAGDSLLTRIENNLKQLSRFPHLGKIPKEKELVELGYFYLTIENYLIFYMTEGKTIWIHRIIHGARDYHNIL